MDSFLRYSTTFLATPEVSRKTCGSNPPLLPFFLSFFGFIFLSKLPLGGDLPHHGYTTKRISARLCGSEQRRLPQARCRRLPGSCVTLPSTRRLPQARSLCLGLGFLFPLRTLRLCVIFFFLFFAS